MRALKQRIAPLGFPFEPSWGKGTRGFQVANICVGWQYRELVWLKRPDGGGWVPEWVVRYNQGHRGLTAILLLTDRLDALRDELLARGLAPSEPLRTSYRIFFNLLHKTMPWRYVFLPPIPGTDLQIMFVELDSRKVLQQMKAYMVPNAEQYGIAGIRRAVVSGDFGELAWRFLQQVFPQANVGPEQRAGNSFGVANVRVHTVPLA